MPDRPDLKPRKLRILHVLRAPLGGLFRHVLDLTQEQIARGHAVGLVVDSLTGGTRAEDILAKLEPELELGLKRLPMPRQPHIRDVTALAAVDAHIRHRHPDVVHGHGSKGGLYARAPGLWHGANGPIRCYTPHGGSFNYVASPWVQSTYMNVERLMTSRTDVLLFESMYIANRFRQRLSEQKALVRIVQNGISDAEFAPITPNTDSAEFLYVGELRSAKGIDTLIDAMAIMSRRNARKPKLILVGTGPDQMKLEAQAAMLGVKDQISFPGAMAARDAFKLGRVLVIPSRAESLPYIVLEAAGAHVPLVTTNVGGIPEIFGPYRDRLIDCDDPIVLADKMQSMLEMDAASSRQQAADLATFVSKRFTVSVMTDSVIAGYFDGIARRNTSTLETKSAVPADITLSS